MDEWDEFLATGSTAAANPEISTASVSSSPSNSCSGVVDLGQFADNAEVLIQVSRGESLNKMASGIWLASEKSNFTPSQQRSSNDFRSQKRTLTPKSNGVPVANSLQDLEKCIPSLPHFLSLNTFTNSHKEGLMAQLNNVTLYEADSIGLFFYGACTDVSIESTTDSHDMSSFMKMKSTLLNQDFFSSRDQGPIPARDESMACFEERKMCISMENLRILANSLPPNGRSKWILPMTITSNQEIDLSRTAILPDFLASQSASLTEFYRKQLEAEFTKSSRQHHSLSLDGVGIGITNDSSIFDVRLNFRGAKFPDSSHQIVEGLFYRHPNFQVEIDAETSRTLEIKLHLPRFDGQARFLLLLKALWGKLSKLPMGSYVLTHQANDPYIRAWCSDIVSLENNTKSSFSLNEFLSK